jgi:hypothetical protein
MLSLVATLVKPRSRRIAPEASVADRRRSVKRESALTLLRVSRVPVGDLTDLGPIVFCTGADRYGLLRSRSLPIYRCKESHHGIRQ